MKKLFILPLLLLFSVASNAQSLLNESFNVTSVTNTMPTGWTVSSTGSSTGCVGIDWNQVPSGGFVCSVNGTPAPRPVPNSGSGMAGYNSWDIDAGSISEMVTPVLDFSATGTNTLSFWVFNQNALISNAHDSLIVVVNTSPTSVGGTRLYANDPNYNSSPAGWVQYSYTIPLTYTSTTNYIIFRGWSNWGQDIFMDDVDVTHNPPIPCAGMPLSPSITTAAIAPANPICSGNTVTINAIDPNFPTTGGTTYQWEESVSATGPWTSVTTGTGANTRIYTTASMSTSTYYRMGVTCTASAQTAYTGAYYVPVGAPQPGVITGLPSFCPGDNSTYSVTSVSGTTYTWTLPASDWSGSSSTNSIVVTPGPTPGNISVTATTSCGTSIPQTKALVPGSSPAAPSMISGNVYACNNSTQVYSITPITGANSYLWTVPSGWSIVGSATGASITVTTSSVSGNVTVSSVNGCGNSSPSGLTVTVVNSLSNPGTITGSTLPCSGALYTYSINPVPGAVSYQWILPSGWSGTTTGTSIQAFAGTTGGTVQVTAYSPCATSPTAAINTTVIPSVVPSVSLNTSSTQICQGTPVTFVATPVHGGPAPAYVWMKNSVPVTASGATYIDNTLSTGDLITVVLVSDATCRTIDSVSSVYRVINVTPVSVPGISINTTPVVSSCAGIPLNFNTTITGAGTAPTYQWYNNGLAIPLANAASYTTASLNNSDTITVQLTTSALCPSVPFVSSNKVGIVINNIVIPTVSIAASSTIPVTGMPIIFSSTQSNGGATPTYQWFLNGVILPYETSDTYTSSTLKTGDHVSVKMLSYETCAVPALVISNEVILGKTTSIAGVSTWEGAVSLFPNPTSGHFTIAATWNAAHTGKRVSIDVLNMIGQSVYHSEVAPDRANWHFDVQLSDGLANGNYVLRLSSDDGMRAVTPFMVTR